MPTNTNSQKDLLRARLRQGRSIIASRLTSPAPSFPRSQTMRLLLRHPGVTVSSIAYGLSLLLGKARTKAMQEQLAFIKPLLLVSQRIYQTVQARQTLASRSSATQVKTQER